MRNTLFLLLFCTFALFGKTIESDEDFTILAKKTSKEKSTITAEENVVIFSKSYYITADYAKYNQLTGELELGGNVNILKNNEEHFISNKTYLDLDDDIIEQKSSFMINGDTKIWLNSNSFDTNGSEYELGISTLSSCDCDDPDWSLRFSSGSYNSESMWVNTFNTRLYIKNTPVFYTPYFGFSANKKRRTGLLPPTMGISSDEGFLYAQPFFIAPEKNWDLELVPQVKTKRSMGMYAYYRYIDTQYSKLKIKTGYIKEKSDYVNKYDLINNKHYGWNIYYERDKLFSKDDHQDGLLVDVHDMNDIEYKNLEVVNKKETYNKLIESKLNYFYKTGSMFYGSYFRYYLDSSKTTNRDTLQQLPEIQIHSFSKDILIDSLFYSADIQYKNLTREEDITAHRYDINIPITLHFTLFDDYLNLSFKEEIVGSKILYGQDGNKDYKNGKYLQAKHMVSLTTDLIKPYKGYIHTINFAADLTIPSGTHKTGDLYGINTTSSDLSPFPVNEVEKNLAFSLNHSLYDKNSLKQIVNQKIKQSILYDNENDKDELSNLEHQISFYLDFAEASNRLLYNHQDDEIIESSSLLKMNHKDSYLEYSHYKSKDTPNSYMENSESQSIKVGTDFMRYYSIYYKEDYNIKEKISNNKQYYFGINKKCWSAGIKFEDSLVAAATTTSKALRQDIIYLQFELKPVGGMSNLKYSKEPKPE